MGEKTILVMDDNRGCYPADTDSIREKYGCGIEFADAVNPIGDGFRRIDDDDDKRIVALISDSFSEVSGPTPQDSQPFWYLAKIRARRPDLLIAVHSAGLSQTSIEQASRAGANEFYRKGESLLPFYQMVTDLVASQEMSPLDRFWHDLPHLLETKFGKWVVCTADGEQHSGDDEDDLYAWCRSAGLRPEEFVVARVLPDQPEAEVPHDWLPRVTVS